MTQSRPLVLIAAAHTLIWLSIEACVIYVLGAGLAGRSDRSVAIAGGIVAAETLVFAANGFRCPLTDLAESQGATRGSVTDIYLPAWFARNLPAIHVPLILLAVALHHRNMRAAGRCPGPPWPGRGRLPLPLRTPNR
jgi:hypothetical protein